MGSKMDHDIHTLQKELSICISGFGRCHSPGGLLYNFDLIYLLILLFPTYIYSVFSELRKRLSTPAPWCIWMSKTSFK